jgi:hypothetical protein
MGQTDKQEAINKLSKLAQRAEQAAGSGEDFETILQRENENSGKYGGRTAQRKPTSKPPKNSQLSLFE